MVFVSKYVLLFSTLLCFLVALQFKGANSAFRKKLITVTITNNIPNYQLGVHCKSKDDDLGSHIRDPSVSYAFSFRPNFAIYNTLYFCKFIWGDEFRYFNIYRELRDDGKCTLCKWYINKSGPCRSSGTDPHCYPWNDNVVT
ncbi:unnamed protein product [Lathyrus oleraceus]